MASLSSAESTSLGDTFQSGARFIKWPDGANHERLSSLLRADGDPIGDGTAEDLGHSIVVFRRIEVQPGVLGILLQQILTLKAATYTLTDQLNQVLKLTFIRGFDALESRGPLFFEQDPDHQNVIVVHAGSGQQRALIYSEYADVEFELDPP